MKILIVSFEFPPNPGGIGEYAYQTAKHLSIIGYNVTVLAAFHNMSDSQFKAFEKEQNFNIVWLKKYTGRTLFLLTRINLFKKLCKKNKFDLILGVGPSAGIIGYFVKKSLKIPYIMVGHGSEFLNINFIRNSLIKIYYNNCNLILANSNFTRNLIEESRIKNQKIEVLFPGADEELFDIQKFQKQEDSSKLIILTVGSLSVRKGHSLVLAAIKKLSVEMKNIEYWIIGKGPEEKNIQKYIQENNLSDYVKLLGYVKRSEMPKYYANADIFILSSTNLDKRQVEGFGIVLIEAGLMKLPVIGVKGTGMEDAVEHGSTGILMDAANVENIENAIKYFVSQKSKIKEFGDNGYTRAKNNFTWPLFADKMSKLIKESI